MANKRERMRKRKQEKKMRDKIIKDVWAGRVKFPEPLGTNLKRIKNV